MLGNVSNDNLIAGNSVNQNENLTGVEKKENSTNPYIQLAELEDSSEISAKAKELLQREQDVEFFTSEVLESPLSNDELNAIMELIRSGEFIDNKDLAEAMQADDDLLSSLFQGINFEEAVS